MKPIPALLEDNNYDEVSISTSFIRPAKVILKNFVPKQVTNSISPAYKMTRTTFQINAHEFELAHMRLK